MRSVRRSVFLCLLLATLTLMGFSVMPKPAAAWGFCHEGTYDFDEWHCYLGVPRDCSECWVI